MSKEQAQVNLNVDELKGFLKHVISNNTFIQSSGKNPVAVEIVGESGIGKTSSVIQLANELKLNFIKLNLSQIEELGDLVGYPIRQFQLCKKTEKPTGSLGTDSIDCLWIDEHAIAEYTKQGYSFTGEKRMSYCPPEWIADKQGGGILLLDDWNRADLRFLQAVMELVDRQEYISWKLPAGWNIFLSANPDNGDYLVNTIDVAQKTRFISANLKFDIDCWARWAEKQGIDGRCINFLLLHPELVTQKCNSRSITNFFNSISSFEKFEDNLPMIQLIGEGSVGPEFSTMFTLFINNKLDKLVSPKEMLTNPNWPHIKGELRSCVGVDNNYRSDIASILSTRLINYSLVYAEKHAIGKDLTDRLIAITTEEILANDLKYYIIKGILNGNKARFQGIMLNQEVVKMAIK